MNINNIHNSVSAIFNTNKTIVSPQISFKQNTDNDCFVRNFDAVDYIELTPDKKKLKIQINIIILFSVNRHMGRLGCPFVV